MAVDINILKKWFETGAKPTQEQFWAWLDSYFHKNETLPMEVVEGLAEILGNKLDASMIENLANKDASNIEIEAWRKKLISENTATIDHDKEKGNVYTKEQSDALYMAIKTFVNKEGKIAKEGIEESAVMNLIEAQENTIEDFTKNADNYTFYENNFIAVPSEKAYSLYLYKGGDKKDLSNYLPTGITEITSEKVKGLQALLEGKLSKPEGLGENFLTTWKNDGFSSSKIYEKDGKYGIGTDSPMEMLHLDKGRIRAKAIVLEENSESLPEQISRWKERYYGTSSKGIRRPFMFKDFSDINELFLSLDDKEKTQLKNALREENETYSTGQPRIDAAISPVVDNTLDYVQYTNLVGLNLFVDNQTPQAKLVMKRVKDKEEEILKTPEVYPIDNFTVLQTAPNMLSFGLNWKTYPEGFYQFFCTHNGLTNLTSPELIVKKDLNFEPLSLEWQYTEGSASVKEDKTLIMTNKGTAKSAPLDKNKLKNGFIVRCSFKESVYKRFLSELRVLLTGEDGKAFGVDLLRNKIFPDGENNTIRGEDVLYISYYQGILNVFLERSAISKTYLVPSFENLPRYFYVEWREGEKGEVHVKPNGIVYL